MKWREFWRVLIHTKPMGRSRASGRNTCRLSDSVMTPASSNKNISGPV